MSEIIPTTLEDIKKLRGVDRKIALKNYHKGIKNIRKEDKLVRKRLEGRLYWFKLRRGKNERKNIIEKS